MRQIGGHARERKAQTFDIGTALQKRDEPGLVTATTTLQFPFGFPFINDRVLFNVAPGLPLNALGPLRHATHDILCSAGVHVCPVMAVMGTLQ